MRLTPSDTVDDVDSNRSFRGPLLSREERILRRNLPWQVCTRILSWQHFRLFQQNRVISRSRTNYSTTSSSSSGDLTARKVAAEKSRQAHSISNHFQDRFGH